MNKLSIEKRSKVISALVEGNSINATCRMTGTAKHTILNLLRDVGLACMKYHDIYLNNLSCKHLQCDEIWSFCYAKQAHVPEKYNGKFGFGDVWTWVALDADTKLVVSWLVGLRTMECATTFINDVKSRLSNRVQLTTDGNVVYIDAIDNAFGTEIDFAQLVKIYGETPENEKRYSPADCVGIRKQVVQGKPDKNLISTSYVERQNLTMRMCMRRFTRLTNAFSKKLEYLEYAVALHYMYYNFARPHKALANPYPRTPAMATGLANSIWTIEDIVKLIGINDIPIPFY
ncbi:MAG: IS1 family transposase [Dehalococcoidales bacterium]|nr:IS1 family transposase [Dehalococcoidales bacterium]